MAPRLRKPNRDAVADRHFEGQAEGTAETETKTRKVEAANVCPDESTLGRRAEHPNLYKGRACAGCISDQNAGELRVRELRQTVAEMVPYSRTLYMVQIPQARTS